MRAAMYYANDDVRIVELPKPRIGPGEVLVRVKASGICGSDVMEWYRKPKAPLVLGHEIAREVVEVAFIEPLAWVIRGQRLAGFRPGSTLLVLGSGVAGLLHIKLAKAAGAAKVLATDVVEFRKAAARKAGADLVIDGREDVPASVRTANGGNLADLVVTCTGAPRAIAQRLASVDRRSALLFFAPIEPAARVEIPFNALWREEVTMTSSYGGSPRDIRESINLLREKRLAVSDLITHVLPLGKAAEGFRLVAQARDSIKVVMRP